MAATNAPHLRGRDTVNGIMGECYITFPDGRRMCMTPLVSITTTSETEKHEIPVLGLTQKQHKKLSESYSGTMTMYDVTSEFREWQLKYKNTGEDFYCELQIINCDPDTATGRQSITYTGVNFDSVPLGQLDINASELQTELSFTFEDWNIEQSFDILDGIF